MKWNPHDYAKNSSAQLVWARELISQMAFAGSELVLDVGCGDGKITAEFAHVLTDGYVLGVDSSTTWMPYTQQLPEELQERFISDLVSEYLKNNLNGRSRANSCPHGAP